jgi:LPS sulfotransferase NodH
MFCPEQVRFVIFAVPRTGSNLLCGMLNSHPSVLCHHGLFNPSGIHYALDYRGHLDFGSLEERDNDPRRFLKRVWRNNFGVRAIGFKLNRGENEIAAEEILGDATIRKILLYRQNRLKTYVSELIAQQTTQWESYTGTDHPAQAPKVHVDPAAFRQHVALNRNYYGLLEAALRTSGQEFLCLDYESLGCGHHLRLVFKFIEVSLDIPILEAPSFKRNSNDLRDLVANFSDLAIAIRGSEFEKDLDILDAPHISEVQVGSC